MTIAASTLVTRVGDATFDPTFVRWTVAEIVRYLNDGQREVLTYRPDAYSTFANMTCIAGTRQTLPTGGIKLISIYRNNTSTSKRTVRLCTREMLDAFIPGWHNLTGVAEIIHYVYDEREPKTFWVYPPATTSAKLDINYSATPTDVTTNGDNTAAGVSGNLAVTDSISNALQDYVLFRCFSKDAEYGGNKARADGHYQAFVSVLGVELQSTNTDAPKPGD